MAELTHFYAEDNTVKNAGASYADLTNVRIAAASLSATTKYLIVARALVGVANATNKGYVRIQTADDTTIENDRGV
jgi:hypothetical protein